ncbi:hypothetical protein GH741_17630 [Aquibacillus halophilus]|uniref:Uncharacterized protein n=1 Tax=Aquibacillus halophilus TaxID=930132 RepID=A0A6A8DFJ3_9BACI|nr:hypothetical protein [Aquibacillus halophilus]MRH44468.1 hypothetical protein [Aquibacillus halophilus]
MNKIEWLLASLLIIIGLSCLTVSATTMLGTESMGSYLKTFIELCFWLGLPIVIMVFAYIVFIKRRKNK